MLSSSVHPPVAPIRSSPDRTSGGVGASHVYTTPLSRVPPSDVILDEGAASATEYPTISRHSSPSVSTILAAEPWLSAIANSDARAEHRWQEAMKDFAVMMRAELNKGLNNLVSTLDGKVDDLVAHQTSQFDELSARISRLEQRRSPTPPIAQPFSVIRTSEAPTLPDQIVSPPTSGDTQPEIIPHTEETEGVHLHPVLERARDGIFAEHLNFESITHCPAGKIDTRDAEHLAMIYRYYVVPRETLETLNEYHDRCRVRLYENLGYPGSLVEPESHRIARKALLKRLVPILDGFVGDRISDKYTGREKGPLDAPRTIAPGEPIPKSNGYIALPVLGKVDKSYHAYSDVFSSTPRIAEKIVPRFLPEPTPLGSLRRETPPHQRLNLPKSEASQNVPSPRLWDTTQTTPRPTTVNWGREPSTALPNDRFASIEPQVHSVTTQVPRSGQRARFNVPPSASYGNPGGGYSSDDDDYPPRRPSGPGSGGGPPPPPPPRGPPGGGDHNSDDEDDDPIDAFVPHAVRRLRSRSLSRRLSGVSEAASLYMGDELRDDYGAEDDVSVGATGNPLARYTGPQRASIRWIETQFNENLAEDAPTREIGDTMRKIKRDPPEKYDGNPTHAVFRSWANAMIQHLSLSGMTGMNRVMDKYRKKLIALHLSGTAEEWYQSEVSSVQGLHFGISSLGVLCELYLEFIPRSAASEAARKFYRIRYSEEDGGISGLHTRMRLLAQQMPQPPGSWAFKTQFLNALPESIRHQLLVIKHLTAEHSTTGAMVQEALRIEDSLRTYRDFQNPLSFNSFSTSNPGPERVTPYQARYRASQQSSQIPNTSTGAAETTAVVNSRPNGNCRPPAASRDIQPQNAQPRQPRPSSTGDTRDKSNLKCWECGQFGHFATDPKFHPVPSTRTPDRRMNAMRADADTNGAVDNSSREHAEPNATEELGFEGFDDLGLDRYEKAEYDEETESDDAKDGVPTARMAAMHLGPPIARPPKFQARIRALHVESAAPEQDHSSTGDSTSDLWVSISGSQAKALCDPAVNTVAISMPFASRLGLRLIELEKQFGLGSPATRYGCWANVSIGSMTVKTYFTVAEIERYGYDAILGAPFLSKHGISVDPRTKDTVFSNGSRLPSIINFNSDESSHEL